MTDNSWNVQIGEAPEGNPGIPAVPTTVYEGDEEGARAAYEEHAAKAPAADYRYVLLRNVGEVVELWGTPPAVG
ncbi:hypothetical protein [Mycobacterium bourgelatii]|uniref:Uncharacterized protein n=1 Tax=Mycobacterium bourgelatii TaxID=1273442 RepID=A0A7I9YKM1_MYCBU|nr:hypothetical protein [Mycobacterium bourgelatii]MCV6976845.1 hypothetical protein [Mycobacterium bourgelatii]GFG89236.1 hypothetical protein MBOU_12780 [Mycobacterium bourgelatii]